MNFVYPPGATPLDPDEAEGLLAGHITTQGDLNTWEQTNILQGELWAARQSKRDLLEERFVRELHQRMFDQTWKWAGAFRSTNKNIGVDWMQVGMQVRNLLDNTHYQMEHQIFSADELAVRFHHQLVMIHPFPNGNGRHARLIADLLIQRLVCRALAGEEVIHWAMQAISATLILLHYGQQTGTILHRCCALHVPENWA